MSRAVLWKKIEEQQKSKLMAEVRRAQEQQQQQGHNHHFIIHDHGHEGLNLPAITYDEKKMLTYDGKNHMTIMNPINKHVSYFFIHCFTCILRIDAFIAIACNRLIKLAVFRGNFSSLSVHNADFDAIIRSRII